MANADILNSCDYYTFNNIVVTLYNIIIQQ